MTELIHTHTQVHTTGEWQSWDVNPELADPKTNLYSNSRLSLVKLEQLNLIMYHRLWLQNKIKTFLLKIQTARINIWSNNITSGHLLKRTETHVQTKTYTWTFTAALFIKAKRGKQPKCSSTGWINKQNVLYPYSGILLIHKKEWSRQYNMVEAWKYYPEWKMSDIRSHIWYDSSYINIQNGQIHRNRKQMSNFQGWEEGKVGCDCLIGTGFPFGWLKCSGTRFMMFYTTLWMYKMSLLANFVFCVFYYIKKEWTWLFKHTHTHTHTDAHIPTPEIPWILDGTLARTFLEGREAALVVSDATTIEMPWFGCARSQVVPLEHRINTVQLCSHARDGPQHVCFYSHSWMDPKTSEIEPLDFCTSVEDVNSGAVYWQ